MPDEPAHHVGITENHADFEVVGERPIGEVRAAEQCDILACGDKLRVQRGNRAAGPGLSVQAQNVASGRSASNGAIAVDPPRSAPPSSAVPSRARSTSLPRPRRGRGDQGISPGGTARPRHRRRGFTSERTSHVVPAVPQRGDRFHESGVLQSVEHVLDRLRWIHSGVHDLLDAGPHDPIIHVDLAEYEVVR